MEDLYRQARKGAIVGGGTAMGGLLGFTLYGDLLSGVVWAIGSAMILSGVLLVLGNRI